MRDAGPHAATPTPQALTKVEEDFRPPRVSGQGSVCCLKRFVLGRSVPERDSEQN